VIKEDPQESGSLLSLGRGLGSLPQTHSVGKGRGVNHIYIWHKIEAELIWLQVDNLRLNGRLEKSNPRMELPHENPLFQLSGVGEPQ
jgi:hypothetical protein